MDGTKDPDIFFVVDRGVRKEAKYFAECRRVFVMRKKWENCFEDVKFCSQQCKITYKRRG